MDTPGPASEAVPCTPQARGGTLVECPRSEIVELEVQKLKGGAPGIEVEEPRSAVAAEPTPSMEHWYGREMLLMDAIGWGLGAVAFAQSAGDGDAADGVVLGAAFEYLVGGPVVHLQVLDNLNAREPAQVARTGHLRLGPAGASEHTGVGLAWVRTF